MKHTPIDWESMTDEQFLDRAKTQIWLSAFASNNPRAPAHTETDRAYAEAQRREKPYLYNRAWNAALRLAGHEPSGYDKAAARGPQ